MSAIAKVARQEPPCKDPGNAALDWKKSIKKKDSCQKLSEYKVIQSSSRSCEPFLAEINFVMFERTAYFLVIVCFIDQMLFLLDPLAQKKE